MMIKETMSGNGKASLPATVYFLKFASLATEKQLVVRPEVGIRS